MSLAVAANPEKFVRAMAEYEKDKFTNLGLQARDTWLQTWVEFQSDCNGEEEWLPLTVQKIARVSSLFKAGRYRSFPNYFSRVKEEHVRAGFPLSPQLLQEAKGSTPVSAARHRPGKAVRGL